MGTDNQVTTQAQLVNQPAFDKNKVVELLALFDGAGNPVNVAQMVAGLTGIFTQGAPVKNVTTATAIGTAAKTTTSSEPDTNTLVAIAFTSGNSANSATVAFNGGMARPIVLGGTASTGAKLAVAAGGVVLFFFDGTNLNQLGVVS